MPLKAGDAIRPITPLTDPAKNCGIQATSVGYITCIDARAVSFHMGRLGGYMQATCTPAIFAANFVARNHPNLSTYVSSKHFPRIFPTNFLR